MEGVLLEQRTCNLCESPICVGEFKKVIDLKNSGLLIYVHDVTDSSEKRGPLKKKMNEAAYILHNAGDRKLIRSDYIKEMCQYRTMCFHCRTIIQRVRDLLDEITEIQQNEVISVCEHCKRLNPFGKCKKCEYLVNKFICTKAIQQKNKQERFKSWLLKVSGLLQSILDCQNICSTKQYKKSTYLDELEKLLQELRSPLSMREPDINFFPESEFGRFSMESLTHNKELLEKLLHNLKSEKLEDKSNLGLLENGEFGTKVIQEVSGENIKKTEAFTVNETQTKTTKSKKRNKKDIKGKERKEKKQAAKPQLPKLLLEKPVNTDHVNVTEVRSEDTESILECEQLVSGRKEMIKGTTVVHLDPHYKVEHPPDKVPLLFEVEAVFQNQENVTVKADHKITDSDEILTPKPGAHYQKDKTANKYDKEQPRKGVFYELSNPVFIDKGWTILPTTKVMRKMFIFKMKPACPQYDWFEHNKKRKVIFYSSGEKLAEIGDDGHGQWFYRNGEVALDFYNTKDLNEGQRYVVYSSSNDVDKGKTSLRTVLASFDYSGNGVVYDKYGNSRLKYNQSEGVLHDEKVGPPSHWQWHSLNDPPVLQTVLQDNYVKEPSLQKLLREEKKIDKKLNEKIAAIEQPSLQKLLREEKKIDKKLNEKIAAIEQHIYLKEKAEKVLRKFKPFQIRMKVLKINDQFSLRVLDQANIYLLFRDGQMSLKLNVGMILINTEIVGIEIQDISDVMTPYDEIPPQSQSVADIQRTLQKVRRIAKIREERNGVFTT